MRCFSPGSTTAEAGNWVEIYRQGVAPGPNTASVGVKPADFRVRLTDVQSGKAQLIRIKDGDTIFVPKQERVYVTGEVRTPGAFPYDDDMTIFTAISLAGGITAKGSNSRITITRLVNGQRREIDAKQEDMLASRRSGHRQAAPLVRIVFLNPSGQLGGAETALLEMLAGLREARPSWNLSVVASAPGPLIEHTAQLGIPSVSCTFPASLARLGEWGRRDSDGRAATAWGGRDASAFADARLRIELAAAAEDHRSGHRSYKRFEDAPARRPSAGRDGPRSSGTCTTIRTRGL